MTGQQRGAARGHHDGRRSQLAPSCPAVGAGAIGLAARNLSAAAIASAASDSDSTIPPASGEIPDESGGPFPGNGTNGVNVLAENGVVGSDVTSSFGTASGVADGISLNVLLNVQDVANGGNPLTGAAVDVWHCNDAGYTAVLRVGV